MKDGARQLFLRESFGVLSTLTVDPPAGFPFGSITPYCADEHGYPIIYISTIAQHTRNILADPRVSLTIMESGNTSTDVQARGRVTCLANARRVDAGERYLRYFPAARAYDSTHDFAFYRLELVRIRFIGGFGQIYWVEPNEFALPNPFAGPQESRIIQHMNADHAEALRQYAGGSPATMTGIDSEGFDLLSNGSKHRVAFTTPVYTMDEARQALVAMAKRPA